MSSHETVPELEVISDLAPMWVTQSHASQLAEVRRAAAALKERMADEPPVVAVRTLERYTIGYPVRYGFWGMALVPTPFTILCHRALLVQFRQRGALRTLLFNPSDETAVPRVPFVARQPVMRRVGYKLHGPLAPHLAAEGLSPDAIDYVAFDHFHFQDLRGVVGAGGRFPRARLLAQRREWEQWDDLHPLHRAFAVPDAKRGVDMSGVALIDDDLRLGDGVYLVRTPGHTAGNQTLFFKTDTGVWGVSENGICADNWSPHASRIRGVARRVGYHGLEVLPNMNTPESTASQYASMVLERSVVDPARGDADFLQMFPSFEVTRSWWTPGIDAYSHVEVRFGELARAT